MPTLALLRLPSVKQGLETLKLLIETRGIGLMTGKSGTGKSCLPLLLESELHTELYKVLSLCHTSVGIQEFYTHLVHALGLETAHRRAAMFRAAKLHILHLTKESRIHPVLLIDEAHYTNFFSFQTYQPNSRKQWKLRPDKFG